MLRLKGCPRCKGDLIINSDGGVHLEHCLQCGYEFEARDGVSFQQEVRGKTTKIKG